VVKLDVRREERGDFLHIAGVHRAEQFNIERHDLLKERVGLAALARLC